MAKHYDRLFFALLWMVLLALCFLFPYTGDDWAWGSEIGLSRLATLFADYNGRYASNLVVLALTRSIVLRSITMATVLTAIVFEIYSLAGKRHLSTCIVSSILLLLVHYRIAAQSIVWTSGFVNYAISALFILIYLSISKKSFSEISDIREPLHRLIGMALLGFGNSLILENVTIFNVIISFTAIVFYRIRHGNWNASQAAFLFGSIAAAAIMFSNGAYWAVAAGTDEYRSISTETGSSLENRAFETMPYYLLANNWGIPACIFLVLCDNLVTHKFITTSKRKLLSSLALVSASALASAFALYSTFLASQPPGRLRNVLALSLLILFFICLLGYCIDNRKERTYTMVLVALLSIAILVTPLFVVNPIGPRNFFQPYILECLIAACLWDELTDDDSTLSLILLSAILIAILIRWFDVYLDVHQVDSKRNSTVIAATEAGENHVSIESLPYYGYVHSPDPTDGLLETRYKLFHNIPESLDITVK